MRIKHVSRQRDAELLDQIKARADGISGSSLARQYRVNSGIIIAATNKVRDCDIEESGEPESTVREAYWQ